MNKIYFITSWKRDRGEEKYRSMDKTKIGIIYKTIIMLVVLYGSETWSLTLRDECRLRVFENRILRRIFGPRGMRMGSGEGST